MKKIILITLFVLIFLSFTGCAKQQNPSNIDNGTTKPVVDEIKNEIHTSASVNMPSFDHPIGWQIISMTDIDLVKSYKDSAKSIFGTNVLGYRSTEINFDRPHDIGPYGRTVDIQIQDFVFETPPTTSEEYLAKIENDWGLQGKQENYVSAKGINFVVWLGKSPVYDADMVLYVTQYTDNEGQKHFVEISRMAAGHEVIKIVLKPVIDSLKF